MKKSLFLLVALLSIFLSAFAFAGDDSLDMSIKVGDVVLDVDGDYTWKTLVEDPGLEYGTEKWNEARAVCNAWDKAWADYREAKKNNDYEKAEKVAPYSVLKGWAAWHMACERFADVDSESGLYVYKQDAPKDVLVDAIKDLRRAMRWAKVAQTVKVVGMDNPAHSADALLKRIENTLGIAEGLLEKAKK